MRDQLSEQEAGTGLIAGLEAPRAFAVMGAIFTLETRDAAYFAIEPSSVPQPPAPTDAQLTELMKNAAQLTRPEFRQLTVVRFSPTQVAADTPIDPAELKKRFDFRKDTLSSPETRTVVQIPAKDAATAVSVAQQLTKGADPGLIAKSHGVEAITYANKPQTAIPDHKVATAAFQTPTGVVASVKGDLGLAVVKVLSAAGRAVTLEEVHPALGFQEIRKDAAAEKVYALTQAYDDAHQSGGSLAAAAAKAGVPAISMGPLTQNGRDTADSQIRLWAKLVRRVVATSRWRERSRRRRQWRVLRRARREGDSTSHSALRGDQNRCWQKPGRSVNWSRRCRRGPTASLHA